MRTTQLKLALAFIAVALILYGLGHLLARLHIPLG